MKRPGLRAKGLALVVLVVAILAGATQAYAVDQTLKNGCSSEDAWGSSITSPTFNTGTAAASISLSAWFEVESIDPVDKAVIERNDPSIGDPSDPSNWAPMAELTPEGSFPSTGNAPDVPWSNEGLQIPPAFQSVGPLSIPSSTTGVTLRIRFFTSDSAYQGFRGVGVDDISIDNGNGGTLSESFEDSPTWTPDAPTALGGPAWQTISNSQGIAIANPLINPDLVTLASGDSGALPAASDGTQYAWFGDTASGTYCGPGFADRPGQTTGAQTPPQQQQQPPAPKHLADLPAPVVGKQANVETVSGTVLVGIKGGAAAAGRGVHASQKGITFVPLSEARQIPIGSFLDTRKGTVKLQSASGSKKKAYLGNFSSGLFQVLQSRKKKAKGLTDLKLKGGNFASCKAKKKKGKKASAALSKKALRRLRGSAKGKFRTSGRYGAATVRGTKWTVTDRCDGTLTQVQRGTVAVRDFRRHKTVIVKTGKKYLARAKR